MQGTMRAEHDALRTMVREFAEFLNGPLPQDMADASKRRLEFSRLFRSHIVAERDYARACLQYADKSVHALMEEYSRAFHALYFDYSRHIQHWGLDRVREDWRGYGKAVGELRERFLKLMDWEDAEILPALAVTE
ncbi:hypothetical protein GCM10007897_29680 [Sphingobium jiangsuense]|uniref:Hemerythrin-like domain-containing protein n=2 Tax=Sphingobium jiangsuense TaxID=870476 RepID=A0A7W6BJ56_9SPHN|nr:hypothetical protein [Sphingobium jiangsuense]GLT01574.1 hypothetical protein GCM10007897_29680 [Sphingobium jiangsuense]